MSQPLPEYPRRTKVIHFAVGFLSWYAIHSLPWWLILRSSGGDSIAFGFFSIPVFLVLGFLNTVGLGLMALWPRTRWLAFGAAAALALNLAASLLLGAFVNALCFIPVYLQ